MSAIQRPEPFTSKHDNGNEGPQRFSKTRRKKENVGHDRAVNREAGLGLIGMIMQGGPEPISRGAAEGK